MIDAGKVSSGYDGSYADNPAARRTYHQNARLLAGISGSNRNRGRFRMKKMRHAPTGLGGWLWPITWLAATLPVLLTAVIVATVAGDLIAILRYGTFPYHFGEPWAQLELGVYLLLTSAAWWWAIRWFARDPRMPRQGPIALLAGAALVETIAWIDRGHTEYHALASLLLALAVAGFIGARFSARVSNTFVAQPLPPSARGWRGTIFDGPLDWSHRRWLLPGTLACAALRLWYEIPIYAEAAFETIPPPHPAGDTHNGGGNAAALIAMAHPGRYIEASRVALVLLSAAVLMIAGALVGLVRGARWTPWITLAATLLAMSAPLYMSIRDWCCPFLDGPPFEHMWRPWCAIALMLTLGGALKRWPDNALQTER